MLFREEKFGISATKLLNFFLIIKYLKDLHFCDFFLLHTAKCQYSNVGMLKHESLCSEGSE
jgi:hypothetical protein